MGIAAFCIALIDAVMLGLDVQGVYHPPVVAYGLMFMPFILTLVLCLRRNTTPLGALFGLMLCVHVAICVYVYLWPFIVATVNGVSTGLNASVHRLKNNSDDNCICPNGVRMLFGCKTQRVNCDRCNDGYINVDDRCVPKPKLDLRPQDPEQPDTAVELDMRPPKLSVATPAIYQRKCGSCMVASAALVLALSVDPVDDYNGPDLRYYPSVEKLRELLQVVEQDAQRKRAHGNTGSFVEPYICAEGMAYLSSWTLPANDYGTLKMPAVAADGINTCVTYDGSCSWAHLHYGGQQSHGCDANESKQTQSCITYHTSNYNRPTPANNTDDDIDPTALYFKLRAANDGIREPVVSVFQFTKRREHESYADFAKVIKNYLPVIGVIHTDSLSNVAALAAGTVYTYDNTSMKYPRRGDGTVKTDHAIVIHGVETTSDGKSYYKVRNSWGKLHRDFKVLAGFNILGIEELFWRLNRPDVRVVIEPRKTA